MDRHDAEDIAFGTSPLDSAPEGLVGRIQSAFDNIVGTERDEDHDEGYAIGHDDGVSVGRDTGRDDERDSVVDFLCANGCTELADSIAKGVHHRPAFNTTTNPNLEQSPK